MTNKYRVVKRLHNNIRGYVIQTHYSFLFGWVKGWEDLYKITDTWAGEAKALVFFATEAQCHSYMVLQEQNKLWK